MPDFVWTPSDEYVESANVTRLARRLGCSSYHELHRVSVEEPERFWPELINDLGIEFSAPWAQVLDRTRGPQWTTWFSGGRVNLARACVHDWAKRTPAAVATILRGENDDRDEWTFAELSQEVTRFAEALVELGVKAGDRVAIFMPMAPAVAVASHACAHIGAVQVPIFSGFAAPAIVQRLQDSGAKVLITASHSYRRGSRVPMREIAEEAVREAPSVERVVSWDRHSGAWDVELGPGELPPLEVDSEHPYLIAYTSGTTGRPKGALHVQGGFLVSIARETAYQSNVRAGGRVLFATDMGWIMGPWTVVGAGAVGAAIVFMEGAPDWPDDRIWRTVEEERVTMLGISPTLVRALIPKGDPAADMSSLQAFCTTGEPWNRDPYLWLFERAGGGRVPIVNISGGTEVGACFLTTVVTEPIKPVALGFPALGQDMDVVDQHGRSLRGEVGELVCRHPWPGMTRGLWQDRERYLDAYWRRFPGIWTHGDWASVDDDGYWFLHGRSDDTLNIAGKRIGPAELESAAVSHSAVQEAAAVGMPDSVKGEVAWLFCVAAPGVDPSDALAREVMDAVAAEQGKAFRPDRVLFVAALPKTRSAKIVRRAVRARALGQEAGDLSSVENPEVLDEIGRLLEQEGKEPVRSK